MSKNNWQLNFHHEAEIPYYEITNGPISLCVNEDDIPEKNGELELDEWQLLDMIKNTLNSANLNFRSENKLELDQHITIYELNNEIARLKKALLNISIQQKSTEWEEEGDTEHAYDCIIHIAREALNLVTEDEKTPYNASKYSEVVPGIGGITPEAREILETIMDAWDKYYEGLKETNGKDYEPSYYGFAYWLVRWSGLIQPFSKNDK